MELLTTGVFCNSFFYLLAPSVIEISLPLTIQSTVVLYLNLHFTHILYLRVPYDLHHKKGSFRYEQ